MRVLLLGDGCIDKYIYGDVNRISPEAPVPVFEYKRENVYYGMVRNVQSNLMTMGVDVDLVISKDDLSIDTMSTKTRYIDIKSGQQLMRVDVENASKKAISIRDIEKLDFLDYSGIVISDYCKGAITDDLIDYIVAKNAAINMSNVPIFVDTKRKDITKYSGCIVKINKIERDNLTKYDPSSTELIVTLGKNGAEYGGVMYPGYQSMIHDVTGAGDTFLSAFVYKYLSNNRFMPEAIYFANKAASLTVKHFGCYSPTLDEINDVK